MSDKGFYIPSLDGVRAIAVGIVCAAHAGIPLVPGGFGVTMFFFLSGYLITTLLRREFERQGSISLRGFYLRRVYRIFPPMYLTYFLGLALTATGLLVGQVEFDAVAAQLLHLTNYWYLFAGADHFVPGTTVYWSLAVEEHFYLVFPLFLLLCWGRIGHKGLAVILALTCGAVLLWRLTLVHLLQIDISSADLAYTYLASDTRVDSILFGCILGVWKNPVLDRYELGSARAQTLVFCISMALLLVSFLYRAPEFRETFRYTLQGIALFPLFILAVRNAEFWLFRWLEWWPMKWIGLLSYSLYLSHMIGLDLAANLLGGPGLAASLVGLSLALVYSLGMYHAVEKPFARLRKRLHAGT